ncbi:type ISP restriction/modification enzyme [Flavobacterium sp. MC2016-06]|jgi:predicted helicase|uniref:type ISP restriction/modification enzyme n=1 Tax=Flavobacterium sp. MC2016-06 TaxID=2676308 RepID=UPI0012BB1BE6|nr:type ISP restriction/modification enzyme [Flavobacterium sp. MC2016-06]MBU3859092.1 hypothetical protein [Flavobacterium sp. MC2016-06]
MAHLKMDMLLTETGYKPTDDQRFRIFLTNSLEEAHPDTQTLFSSWLSDEADQANAIKRDSPVMVVIGNPPYSGESSNKGEWIMNLMEDYKKEPGGKEKLKERNPKWINDDYVKFIRFGQHFIDKNGEGILAFINPHGFLDSPTFRGMRWNLLQSFDKIYTLDLHGNSTKKEISQDGSIDQNVFDIMQGVSINIFIKTGEKKKNELGKVYHYDLFGKRDLKYDFLVKNTLKTINYIEIPNTEPMYFMVKKNFEAEFEYKKGFELEKLFTINSLGFVTARDHFTIHDNAQSVKNTIEGFLNIDNESARIKYNLGKDVRDWQVNLARKDLEKNYPNKGILTKISYRPFDEKYTFYTGNSKGFYCYPRNEIMKHFLHGNNIALNLCKIGRSVNSHVYFLSNKITDKNLVSSLDSVNTFPLYLYPESNSQQIILDSKERVPNLNMELVQKFSDATGLTFTNEKEATPNTFAPIDILDYIYAVLHSPTYRETYKEFLKIDFPRVPTPLDHDGFIKLVKLGSELRQLHLLESAEVENYITEYPEDGENIVGKPKYVDRNFVMENNTITHNDPPYPMGRVYINETQYFENVPETAWNFYIGGYQPAQKWLKDRKDRELSFDDIFHYQKMIVALFETDRIMKEIDKIEI